MIRKLTLFVGAVAVAGTSLFVATDADAYVLLTPNRKWYQTPVLLEFNSLAPETSITDGEYGRTAIADAIFDNVNGWNGAGAGQLIDATIVPRNAVMGDGRPTIQFNDPHNYCTGACLAVTMTGYWHNRNGLEEIDDADIYFDTGTRFTSENEDPNPNQCSWNEYYIEGIVQHEVGHLLGLDHSNNGQATMYYAVGMCDNTMDEIANDDQNGINALY
ncbi:MAG: matrixin family metalloprotease [Myxococcales bacterium]|nr:matrixin family metalloprotease [Myxococcales bacterium]